MTAGRCLVVAEIGSNHNRDLGEAYRLIELAAEAGCDAVKFQTFSADTLYSPFAPRLSEMETFQGDDGQITPHQLLSKLEMPREWLPGLAARCSEAGIEFMSAPFDLPAVDQLDPLVRRHKLASYDLTNRQLVQAVAGRGKPVVLSTGHAFLGEVESSIGWAREVDPDVELMLLHCTSEYPTPPADVNLRALATMRDAFALPCGLSDHTEGIEIPLAAAALGAVMIEKHFTSDSSQAGPDHSFALEPDAMKRMVDGIRAVEQALGDGRKAPTEGELENRLLARRSIHARVDLEEGHELTGGDLVMLRPGTGIRPAELDLVLGRRLRQPVTAGAALTWEVL